MRSADFSFCYGHKVHKYKRVREKEENKTYFCILSFQSYMHAYARVILVVLSTIFLFTTWVNRPPRRVHDFIRTHFTFRIWNFDW